MASYALVLARLWAFKIRALECRVIVKPASCLTLVRARHCAPGSARFAAQGMLARPLNLSKISIFSGRLDVCRYDRSWLRL